MRERLLRRRVQAAGIGHIAAEGMLWVIDAPRTVRDELLTARQAAKWC